MENSNVPIKNQIQRPHLSDSKPNKGLSNIPVKVEAETIKPKKVVFAPNPTAKRGRRGVLPI